MNPIYGTGSNENPLVSIITPFYNTAPKYFEEAIRSVFAQTYEHWELVLVDDGSAGPSSDLARSYAEKYPEQVFYLEHAGHANKGHPASRNLGIHNSKGKYIAFLDADDVWMPRKLEDQVTILETRPEAGMVYANTLYWHSWTGNPEDENQDYLPKLGVQPEVLYRPPVLLPLFLTGEAAVPSMNSLLIRRDSIVRSGRFDESFRSLYGDQHFYAKVCLSESIFVSGNCHDRYRQHSQSMTSRTGRAKAEIPARRYFLHWLEGYLTGENIADRIVWQALRREIWRVRSPDWLPRNERVQDAARRIKKWLLKAEERTLPESIRKRIWTKNPSGVSA